MTEDKDSLSIKHLSTCVLPPSLVADGTIHACGGHLSYVSNPTLHGSKNKLQRSTLTRWLLLIAYRDCYFTAAYIFKSNNGQCHTRRISINCK